MSHTRPEGTQAAVSFHGAPQEERERRDSQTKEDGEKQSSARGTGRDNFLSAAVLGNMVSLGSDGGHDGMMAVRHARLIQQLILASGNEASKAYEKWQRRGKASMAGGKTNEDLLQNDVRKAGNKLRQRRRGNLLARLELTEAQATDETRVRRGTTQPEALSGEAADDDTPREESQSEDSSETTTSSSTSSDDSEEVPALGFMRVAGRRASLSVAETLPLMTQRRAALRQPSLVAKVADFPQPGEGRKRQSQVGGHWGQLAGLARMLIPNQDHGQGSRGSALLPESGSLASPRRLSGEGKSEDQNEADAPDEIGLDSRRKLPEVFGISKFRQGTTIMHEQWQEPVATLKRLHLDVASRLGLDEEDWDPDQTYLMSLQKFQELAELKFLRRQYKAAVWIQARWRSIRIRRPMRQVIYKRLQARQRIREWIRKVIRRKRVADQIRNLRLCIVSAIKIQANVRRWLVKKELASAMGFHQVQFRMAALQERLYPSEERERDREANERSMMSREEVLSQEAENARRMYQAQIQRAVAVLQPAVRRWLSRVRAWRLLQEREKELREEHRRHRRFRDRDDDEYRPLSRSNFASGRSGVGSLSENGMKKAGSGSDSDLARSLEAPGHPTSSFWHGPSGKALLALEAMATTVEESTSRSQGSQVRVFRARAYRKSTCPVLPPAPPGFRSDIAGARGGPKRGTPRLVSVPQPVSRKVKARSASAG